MYKDFAQFVFFKKLILFFNFCDIMLYYIIPIGKMR